MNRILYLGFYADADTLQRAFAHEVAPQISAIRFQTALLQGLAANRASLSLRTCLPIAPWPRNTTLWIAGHRYTVPDTTLEGRLMPCLNLPGVRLLWRFVTSMVATLRSDCDAILVYSLHSPLLAAARLRKLLSGTKILLFIPDLPQHMGGQRGPVRRALKTCDARLLRWLARGVDVTFPFTAPIAEDWLPASIPSVVIEGIAPAQSPVMAATVGKPVPRLLYTGAFAQVERFARLFAASDIAAELVLVGGGPERDELQALAARDSRIRVKDFMLGEALDEEMAAADYFINPRDSQWPGARYSFPSKLHDYMARGKPILSTRLPGIPEAYFECFYPIDDRAPDRFVQDLRAALAATDHMTRVQRGFTLLQERSPQAVGAQVLAYV